jgi:predicted nucleotidyltransferase
MPTLADARLSAAERRMLDRFVAVLRERLGDDLISVWLFGSRARGEATGPLSDAKQIGEEEARELLDAARRLVTAVEEAFGDR